MRQVLQNCRVCYIGCGRKRTGGSDDPSEDWPWLNLRVSSLTGVLKLHWIDASLRSLTLQYLSVMNFLPFSDAQSSYAPFIERLGSLAFWRGTFL